MLYSCSVCKNKVEGDLIVFKDHTERHIIDLVKHDHPEWAKEDGLCQKCFDYYNAEIKGSIFKDAPCALRLRKGDRIKQAFMKLFGFKAK